jgi:hypothetical protein
MRVLSMSLTKPRHKANQIHCGRWLDWQIRCSQPSLMQPHATKTVSASISKRLSRLTGHW